MRIQEMFQKDIDRDINGVVKVDSENEQQTIQELEEYVVTRELQGHFDEFFSNFCTSIDRPTEKMGVWISGFFGSGKSHFLKMLSYLLENPVVGGRHAIDYFTDDHGQSRFANPMTTANVERCASLHAQTILFNIDNIAGADDGDAAILYSFARAFYNAQGFYGNDLKVARLEQLADEQGKTEAFKNKFLERNGMPWESMRKAWSFYTDDVIGALAATDVMSETEAERYLGGGVTR